MTINAIRTLVSCTQFSAVILSREASEGSVLRHRESMNGSENGLILAGFVSRR